MPVLTIHLDTAHLTVVLGTLLSHGLLTLVQRQVVGAVGQYPGMVVGYLRYNCAYPLIHGSMVHGFINKCC